MTLSLASISARIAALEARAGTLRVQVVDPNGIPPITRGTWPAWRYPHAYFADDAAASQQTEIGADELQKPADLCNSSPGTE